MTETVFGPVVSTWDVELAVISTLREWINEYLRDIEIKRGLKQKTIPRPPAADSIHGGVDLESWRQERGPEIIAVVKPTGAPTLRGQGGYEQGYTLEIGCVWVGAGSPLVEQPEDEARAVASYLGAAVSMLVLNQPTFGGLTERLRLTAAPVVTAPNPDRKELALCTTSFEMWVATIVEEGIGPLTPGKPYEEPYPAEAEAKTTKETVKAVLVSEEV